MTNTPVRHADTIIFPASLDPRAVSIVERLTEGGFESYLVGGCVRDLLLGHIPKDFDVSTAARPRQVRRIFRNCRIIGRRFKLAHVHFGEHIIEVATFRQNPSSKPAAGDDQDAEESNEDLLITRDNEFGTAEEDSVRRDFTINALLYDVATAEVIDYVGGVKDLEARVLRTIGDAPVRIAEDPVRMLRAIKFAARLDLSFDDELDKAMHDCAELISRSAPPRVLEEIYKQLTCGCAERSLAMLFDFGLFERLLPEVAPYWLEHRDELLAVGRALDQIDQGGRRVSNAFVLAALWYRPWRDELEADGDDGHEPDAMNAAADILQPAAVRMNIPRRDVGRVKSLLTLQLKLERSKRGRRFRMNDFLARAGTQEAIDLLYLRCLVGEGDAELHESWTARLAERFGDELAGERSATAVDDDAPPPKKRRRRRSRGGRGRSGRGEGRGEGRGDGRRRSQKDGDQAADGPAQSSAQSEQAKPDDNDSRPAPAKSPDAPPVRAAKPDDAPSHADSPSRPGSDLTQPAPESGGPSHEATAASGGASSDPAPRRGLRAIMGRIVKRVLGDDGKPEVQPSDRPGTDAPSPSAARATGSEQSEQAKPSADPPARSEAQDEDPAAASEATGDGTSADPAADAGDRPPRRKRRRRRSRSRRQDESSENADGGDGATTESSDTADSDADAPSSAASDTPGGENKPGGRKRSRRRRGGRNRSGRGARDADTGGEQGGASGDEGESTRSEGGSGRKKTGGRSDSGSSRKSGGSGRGAGSGRKGKSSKPSRSRGDKQGSSDGGSSTDSDSGGQGPGQRHPEDVEDIFDW